MNNSVIKYHKILYYYEADISHDSALYCREGIIYGKSVEDAVVNFREFLLSKNLKADIIPHRFELVTHREYYEYLYGMANRLVWTKPPVSK